MAKTRQYDIFEDTSNEDRPVLVAWKDDDNRQVPLVERGGHYVKADEPHLIYVATHVTGLHREGFRTVPKPVPQKRHGLGCPCPYCRHRRRYGGGPAQARAR